MGKRIKPEEIITKLREVEIHQGKGLDTGSACRQVGISEQTYYRWRKQYGGMKIDQAKKHKELERENIRLKKLVANLSLNNAILKKELEDQKQGIIENHQNGDGLNIKEKDIRPYIKNLHETLLKGEITERKSFIRSFVKKITLDYPKIELEYTFPLPTKEKDRT